MSESQFKFELGDKVAMVDSDEVGTVVGRAEYTGEDPSYLLRYKSADGQQVKRWWQGDDLDPDVRKG